MEVLEKTYTLRGTEGEIRALIKALQCLPLYPDQKPERSFDSLQENEIRVLRELRAQGDKLL
ncbi:hypothetical protein ACJJJB_00125 (plasmid) [Microbulbifer sp. ANSA001]|uniref:hypothetical protein n=1 Tax=Microbulbifer sp. ANSA001 TaxID=3243358 RepID=UPI004041B8E3